MKKRLHKKLKPFYEVERIRCIRRFRKTDFLGRFATVPGALVVTTFQARENRLKKIEPDMKMIEWDLFDTEQLVEYGKTLPKWQKYKSGWEKPEQGKCVKGSWTYKKEFNWEKSLARCLMRCGITGYECKIADLKTAGVYSKLRTHLYQCYVHLTLKADKRLRRGRPANP